MRNIYQIKIESFYSENKRMPSYSEMLKLFGFKSKNAVFKVVEKLMEAGLVAKDHLGRLIPSQGFGEIQVAGLVTAGLPATVEEELADTVNLDDLLVKNKATTYMLEVDGDSMIDAHIEKGDMVLVERATVAKDRQIVIAEVDGEFTMKYFRRVGNKTWLEPANKNYKAIYPVHSLNINAVLKAVIRKY
ncbi:repressor LexA [Candidatus Nomurabacteria bacterium RIFCSPLOWO2_02_40_28]|uniref:LexA repressor n=2 Tax=Candidatus Nomuraibacteriota TaxID=1752729 RepID=A0A837HWI2_9BACT|nr:MAG: LexA repressor [Candidatus Nomurabacteria bacterium GW2011_GWD2_39_12]KKR20714.1 MAG: LexA repressor [Candidatus Nomurabacteria bacterium GW2011_GWC2_39_41]KKR37358.1 MAG: LexA repressor [Candidatus Nomurabacteria bacterium GW2011_GWE2_40_10]KKR38605.1 MAG: LexA repressor [Candidatus Nomurabacteria bacterium GW2011_GWB1_40_11]KKR40330.1 MAG: LexA repressor [Parcubacteria group bacterium GW2011_GWC1_40_11]KKR59561.1 MAG: LexA repressor [Candidatus Nomurabacteria bacterium GW2011_GWF2_40